ncbi:MAG: InlB B-repeat-containing protein, partial [Oscillospiraceae bacterium]|nr:InlB B-repeat-containing protein [Oscillospiraceae bacterium]
YEDLIDKKSVLLDIDGSSGAKKYSIADMWFLTQLGIFDKMGFKYGPYTHSDDHLAEVISVGKKAILNGSTSGKYGDYPYDDWKWTYTVEPAKWVNSGSSGYVEKVMKFPQNKGLVGSFPHNATFTLRFSDFSVVPILPDNTGKNYVTTSTEDTAVGEPDYVYEMTNTTLKEGKLSQKESTSYSNTVTNTVNHSTQYSFKEGIEFGVEHDASAVVVGTKLSVTVSAEFQQAITDGWTKGESKTCNSSVDGSGDIPVPPHTIVRLERRKTQSDTVTRYNCPVALKYKVEMIANYMDDVHRIFTTNYTFNYDAAAQLKKRAIDDGGDHYDPENINWNKVLSDKNVNSAVRMIANHVPMSGVGATITQHLETTNIRAVTSPLYPLGKTVMTAPDASFVVNGGISNQNYLKAEMKVGDSYSTSLLNVKGYDTKGAEYYGFSKTAGHWAVVNTDNSEFAEGESPIKLTKDAVSGLTQFTAVKPGKCRLVFMIDENTYAKTTSPFTYTKNSDLTGRATMEITVTGEKANFEITGDFHGYVSLGDDIVKANLEDSLEVSAYDNTDMEVDVDYYWQARETAKKGIKVSPDGTVVFSKAGTFHVRVVNKDDPSNYSSWYEITSEQLGNDDLELVLDQEYDIPDDNSVWTVTGSFTGQTGIEPVSLEIEGGLVPAVYGTDGRELNVDYKWEKQENNGMTLTKDGYVTFDRPGTYHVRIACGNYFSDWKEITAYGDETYFDVVFDTNGGTTVASQTVDSGKTASRPSDPVKIGYAFDKWYSDAALTKEYDFNSAVTSDITLYAGWKAAPVTKYTITAPAGVTVSAASAQQGDTITVTMNDQTVAVLNADGREIARVSGYNGTFTMPASDVKLLVIPTSNMFAGKNPNSYVYVYDADMNPIMMRASNTGSITLKLGSENAGKAVTLYAEKKSTKEKLAEATADEDGDVTLTIDCGKNYTLVIE